MKKITILAIFLCNAFFTFAQNVGIGTTTPEAKLEVKTTTNYVSKFGGVSPMFVSIYENDTYRGYWGSYSGNTEDVDFGTGAGNTVGKLHFTIQAVPKFTINTNGNVGIGTMNPNYKMHLNGGDLFVQSSSGVIRFGYEGANEWQMATTGAGADLRWYTTTDGGATIAPRHYFSQNGDVGIGGFSGSGKPISRLDVVGAGTTSSTSLFALRNASGDTLLRMRDDGRMGIGYNGTTYGRTLNLGGTGINMYTPNNAFGGAIYPTDTSLVLWSNSNANNYLVLQPSWGNTGVGTYTPNAKFHVNGAMLIGSNNSRVANGYSLSVTGRIICTDITSLPTSSWPDYVFDKEYKIMPLDQLEASINKNKHLPNIPSAKEIETNGIAIGEMSRKTMEKIEELTLYIIELNKKNIALAEKVEKLEQQIAISKKQ
mgnify:CR=1 FL=1